MKSKTGARPTPLYVAPSPGERVEVCSRCHQDGRRLVARQLDGTITWWCPGCGKYWQAESTTLRDS
jgi:hypothetical protein